MKVILKQGAAEISIAAGPFEAAVSLAEALLPFSAKSRKLWITISEETEEDPEPEKAEKEDPEPAGKRVDTGKIYALKDAGWPVKDIARELHCAENTVRNYLKKREEKE